MDYMDRTDRAFKFEFLYDLEEMKDKASKGKKTIHGLLNFMNELVNTSLISLDIDWDTVCRSFNKVS